MAERRGARRVSDPTDAGSRTTAARVDELGPSGTSRSVTMSRDRVRRLHSWTPAPRPEIAEDTMTTTRPTRPGKPPIVDLATWEAARHELLAREKEHIREGDAIAAARRRLPMVEIDGTVEVIGADGPVPFTDLFEGRDELAIYQHMWYDGAPHQG